MKELEENKKLAELEKSKNNKLQSNQVNQNYKTDNILTQVPYSKKIVGNKLEGSVGDESGRHLRKLVSR